MTHPHQETALIWLDREGVFVICAGRMRILHKDLMMLIKVWSKKEQWPVD